eukprot:g19730.t1
MAEQGGRYTPSIYLSVTDDANRWREGPPQPTQLTNQSKINLLMNTGQGLAIEKNLSKFDVKVLAAETRKQAWMGIGPKSTYVVYIIRVCRIKDGASCISSQRYSELRSLYNQLKSDKQVRAEGAPEFPGKRVVTEDSFLGDKSDSNSEFVRHRKEQLSSFLRQLFNKNPELWDHPDVKEVFNLEALELGKSYAERAHAAGVGNGVGHGLRNYDPSNPSQWNPYSIAMQAAQQNRARNTDFIQNNNTSEGGGGDGGPTSSNAGGGGGDGEDRGGGIGTWFRGGGDAGPASSNADGEGGHGEDRSGGIGGWFRGIGGGRSGGGGGGGDTANASSGDYNGGYAGGGAASAPWRAGGTNSGGAMGASPVELQVQALKEMGFEEDAARLALRASGYDTNLAAEYCVTGIPPARRAAASAAAPAPAPSPAAPSRGGWRGKKTVIGNNVVPASGSGSGSTPAWRRAALGGNAGGVSNGGGYGAVPASEGPAMSGGRTAGLDWRNMPRASGGGGGGGGRGSGASATGGGGGTVDV